VASLVAALAELAFAAAGAAIDGDVDARLKAAIVASTTHFPADEVIP
jgi:hypothetical protein